LLGAIPAWSGQYEDAIKASRHGDFENAFANFYQLAIVGDSNAMFELSLLYSSGRGVSRDAQQAMRWLKQAASHGNVQAQSNLGVAFNRGLGVTQNSLKAFVWLSMASASGDNIAVTNLAVVTRRLSVLQLTQAKDLLRACAQKMPQVLGIPECI